MSDDKYLDGDYRIDNDKPYLHYYDLPVDNDLIATIAGVKKRLSNRLAAKRKKNRSCTLSRM